MSGPLAFASLLLLGACGTITMGEERRRHENIPSVALMRLQSTQRVFRGKGNQVVSRADRALEVMAGCTQAIVDQHIVPIEAAWVRSSLPGLSLLAEMPDGTAYYHRIGDATGAAAFIEGSVASLPRSGRLSSIELRLVGADARLKASGRYESVDGDGDGFGAGRRLCHALLTVD
jgi:hypothetical protein